MSEAANLIYSQILYISEPYVEETLEDYRCKHEYRCNRAITARQMLLE
jgi:hypothetical protein